LAGVDADGARNYRTPFLWMFMVQSVEAWDAVAPLV
jgi:hypothetical protein